VSESKNIAQQHPEIVDQLLGAAKEAYTPLVAGKMLDKSKLFTGKFEPKAYTE